MGQGGSLRRPDQRIQYSVLGTRYQVALALAVLLSTVLGCGDARPAPREPESESAAVSQFDAATAGSLTGRVRWKGDLPSVPPFIERPNILAPDPNKTATAWPNPNAPVIDTDTRGVKGAVVYLRGIDARRARSWDWPPVRVVQQGQQFHVHQGDTDGEVGFVRLGDAVELVSADPVFHSLHANGAAFFTLAFPDPDRPRRRRLLQRGIVELTSAAGYFWMRGYLCVDDQPYCTLTDAAGQFRLADVPPGRYEVVCWLPDWREERHERDPETSLVCRLFFRPPMETVRAVDVPPTGAAVVEFDVAAPR
jgi:hypothetical protein